MQVVSRQKPFGINGNRRNKLASRICQGAVTPSFGPLDHVSCLGPLGARPGVLHDPRVFINSCHPSGRAPNGPKHDTRSNGPKDSVAASWQILDADLFR